jgi:hypothetical protein
VHAASLDELAKVLERIRKIKGIGTTETSIHLQTSSRLDEGGARAGPCLTQRASAACDGRAGHVDIAAPPD